MWRPSRPTRRSTPCLTSKGQLNKVNTAATPICTSPAVAVSWDSAGPQGPQGPIGPASDQYDAQNAWAGICAVAACLHVGLLGDTSPSSERGSVDDHQRQLSFQRKRHGICLRDNRFGRRFSCYLLYVVRANASEWVGVVCRWRQPNQCCVRRPVSAPDHPDRLSHIAGMSRFSHPPAAPQLTARRAHT